MPSLTGGWGRRFCIATLRLQKFERNRNIHEDRIARARFPIGHVEDLTRPLAGTHEPMLAFKFETVHCQKKMFLVD